MALEGLLVTGDSKKCQSCNKGERKYRIHDRRQIEFYHMDKKAPQGPNKDLLITEAVLGGLGGFAEEAGQARADYKEKQFRSDADAAARAQKGDKQGGGGAAKGGKLGGDAGAAKGGKLGGGVGAAKGGKLGGGGGAAAKGGKLGGVCGKGVAGRGAAGGLPKGKAVAPPSKFAGVYYCCTNIIISSY